MSEIVPLKGGSGTGGFWNDKSKLMVGVASIGIAGSLYYLYRRKKSKRQEELNKKFQSKFVADGDMHQKGPDKPKSDGTQNEYQPRRGVSRDVIIPKDLAAGFIGKNGSYIRKLQLDTNTRISSKATLENGDRMYSIHGLSDDVALAEHHVKRFISLQPVFFTKEILVPSECVGAIIGVKGETVRSIQERSKAKIKVDPTEDEEIAFFAPSTSTTNTKSTPIIIRGTEEQIKLAIEIIDDIIAKKVKSDERKHLAMASPSRTNRMVLKNPAASQASVALAPEDEKLDFKAKADGTFEVYVSCVFDPNLFFIQPLTVKNSAQLDTLTDEMTEYYNYTKHGTDSVIEFKVGDIVAAPFDYDKKIYRAKVIEQVEGGLKICYVDYGDRRTLKPEVLKPMKTEFLRLRFQALAATLDMEAPVGGWSDEIIEELCMLTFAGNWHSITAKKVEKLSDANNDKVCIELFTKNRNQLISIKDRLMYLYNTSQQNKQLAEQASPVPIYKNETNGNGSGGDAEISQNSTENNMPATSYAAAVRKNSLD